MAELIKEQRDELACTYAALILHDDNVPITSGKLSTLIKAAGVSVPAYYPSLFERVFASRNLDDILASSSSSGVTVVTVPPPPNCIYPPDVKTCKNHKKGMTCEYCKEVDGDVDDEPLPDLFGDIEDY